MNQLNYKSFGAGSPVIILHGLFGMLDNWQTFAKQLADLHTVYIVDQRNHGRSFHSDDFSYSLSANDIASWIKEMGIENPHIMGHSMGGKTAMQLAIEWPELIASLIVVDIAPKAYPDAHSAYLKAILGLDIEHISTRQEADRLLSQSIPEAGVRLFLLKNLSRYAEKGFVWKANFQAIHDNYEKIRGAITSEFPVDIPALFVRGSQSHYISAQDYAPIKKVFPSAHITTIDSGHWIHAEQPEALLSLVTRHLNDIAS